MVSPCWDTGTKFFRGTTSATKPLGRCHIVRPIPDHSWWIIVQDNTRVQSDRVDLWDTAIRLRSLITLSRAGTYFRSLGWTSDGGNNWAPITLESGHSEARTRTTFWLGTKRLNRSATDTILWDHWHPILDFGRRFSSVLNSVTFVI